MEYQTLNNGLKMPIVGFGVFRVPDKKECEESVYQAIKAGYRLIDTAQSYGNEEAVGKAIQETNVPREELFITTKVWISNYGYEKAKASVEESLKKMQLDYFDLVLLHQPFKDYHGAYRALIDLYKEKVICSSSKVNVYFNEIKDEEAEWYVNNEEKIFKCCGFVPLGKAALFINKIEGDYNTLLGISPSIVYNKLKELGYSVNDLWFEKSLS